MNWCLKCLSLMFVLVSKLHICNLTVFQTSSTWLLTYSSEKWRGEKWVVAVQKSAFGDCSNYVKRRCVEKMWPVGKQDKEILAYTYTDTHWPVVIKCEAVLQGQFAGGGMSLGMEGRGGREEKRSEEKKKNTNQYEEFHYAGMLEGGCLTGTPNKKGWE